MSTQVNDARRTIIADREIVVFLIGATILKWWRVWEWVPVLFAMPRMIRELEANPDSGFLTHRGSGVQYWRSLEDLLRYASDRDGAHYPAWADFYRKAAKSQSVGIWHETYVVPCENIEALYFGGRPRGLATVYGTVSASGNRKSARGRLRDLAA